RLHLTPVGGDDECPGPGGVEGLLRAGQFGLLEAVRDQDRHPLALEVLGGGHLTRLDGREGRDDHEGHAAPPRWLENCMPHLQPFLVWNRDAGHPTVPCQGRSRCKRYARGGEAAAARQVAGGLASPPTTDTRDGRLSVSRTDGQSVRTGRNGPMR